MQLSNIQHNFSKTIPNLSCQRIASQVRTSVQKVVDITKRIFQYICTKVKNLFAPLTNRVQKSPVQNEIVAKPPTDSLEASPKSAEITDNAEESITVISLDDFINNTPVEKTQEEVVDVVSLLFEQSDKNKSTKAERSEHEDTSPFSTPISLASVHSNPDSFELSDHQLQSLE